MATKILQTDQEYRPPPYLGIIPKKQFFTASLMGELKIMSEPN